MGKYNDKITFYLKLIKRKELNYKFKKKRNKINDK